MVRLRPTGRRPVLTVPLLLRVVLAVATVVTVVPRPVDRVARLRMVVPMVGRPISDLAVRRLRPRVVHLRAAPATSARPPVAGPVVHPLMAAPVAAIGFLKM